MHAAIAAISTAVLFGPAAAQAVTIRFTSPDGGQAVGGSEPIEWTVSASFTGFDDPTAYFGGFRGAFLPRVFGSAFVFEFENLLAHGGPPVINGDAILKVDVWNSAQAGTDDPSNPIDVARFASFVELFRVFAYTAVGEAWVYPDDHVLTPPVVIREVRVETEWIFAGNGGFQGWGCGPADQAMPFGVMDGEDVLEFRARFLQAEEGADLAPPNGVLDLADLAAFVESFVRGCDWP
jgi:hypothetical protein